MSKKDSRLARAGVSGFNKPKRTPNHPKKSHIVVAKEGDKIKTIRFGQQGKKVGTLSGTAGKPKAGESARMKAKRKSFKARHGKNIKKGKMSAAYWADKVKWWLMKVCIVNPGRCGGTVVLASLANKLDNFLMIYEITNHKDGLNVLKANQNIIFKYQYQDSL